MKRNIDTEKDSKPGMSGKRLKPTTQNYSINFEPGKWLIHLSTPVEFDSFQNELIEKLVLLVKSKAELIPEIKNVCKLDEFHISVSKPFLLKNSQSKLLLENAEKATQEQKKFETFIDKLIVLENNIETYEYESNGSGSERKIFVGFEIFSSDQLNNLIKKVDLALK
ncbi:hypothetical protein BpHYR1_010742, partial [Brachionus plicatilis]